MNIPVFTSIRLMQLRKLCAFLNQEPRKMQDLKKELNLTERPIKQLIADLREFYGYDISYNRKEGKYEIYLGSSYRNVFTDIGTDENRFNEVRISLGLNQTEFLGVLQELGKGKVIQIEDSTQTAGLQHVPAILQAMRAKQVLQFEYQKITDLKPIEREVVPYIIKEFRNEWHLVGLELRKADETWDGGWLKFYNLSKIEKLEILADFSSYIEMPDIYEDDRFLHCYGAFINEEEGSIEDVVLAFPASYKKHLEHKKFHSTQKILPTHTTEVRIKLRLHIGHYGTEIVEYNQDLLHDLASYGRQVKVIEPPHLAQALKTYLQEALAQYGTH
jgi:hypothetical protein